MARAEGGNGALRLLLLRLLCAAHGEDVATATATATATAAPAASERLPVQTAADSTVAAPVPAAAAGGEEVVRGAPRWIEGGGGAAVATVATTSPRVWRTCGEGTARPLPPQAAARALRALCSLRWPRARDRDVAASHYLSLSNLPNANARQRRRMNRYRWEGQLGEDQTLPRPHQIHMYTLYIQICTFIV